MKVFIWQRVDKATSNYHPEGGVVAFAKSEKTARALAAKEGCEIGENEKPDHVRPCDDGPELCFIMPDAGCC